jgi:tetratricopeptide (TPR) repeat protein
MTHPYLSLKPAPRFILCICFALSVAACSNTPTEVKNPTDDPTNNTAANTNDPKKPPPAVTYQETSASTRSDIEKALDQATNGQTDAAISSLKSILSADDKAFLAAFNLGVLYDQQNNPSEAASFYEKTLQIEPDFSPALLNLARLQIRRGQPSLDIVDRYISQRPENVNHKLARIDVLLALKRPEDAIADARGVLKIDEANARARYYLAYSHYISNRFPLAQFIINGALEIDQQDPEIFFLSGLIHSALDEPTEAAQQFQRAVELRSDFPEAQNARGLALYRIRDFDGADAAFSAALKYDPSLKEAHLNRGNTLKALGRGDEAEKAYEAALVLQADWADVHFALGALYLAIEVVPLSSFGTTSDDKLKRLEKARNKIEEAKKLWGNDKANQQLAEDFISKVERNVEAVNEAKFFEDGDNWDDGGGGEGGGDDWGETPGEGTEGSNPEGGATDGGDDWGDDPPTDEPPPDDSKPTTPPATPTPPPTTPDTPPDDDWDDDK